jgi:DNA-binding transcriptional ArsR family regulator
LSIARLAACAGITRQAVTRHLRLMEQAGLVLSRRRGRDRVWQLQRRRFEEARSYLAEISTQWDAALERLRAFVGD